MSHSQCRYCTRRRRNRVPWAWGALVVGTLAVWSAIGFIYRGLLALLGEP